jgi:hypothetical protein
MGLQTDPAIEIPAGLLDAVRNLPLARAVDHCGEKWVVSPFDIYARCPQCGAQIKLRSFSAAAEIEDIFDAVFEWLQRPGALDLVRRRQKALQEDDEEV